MYSRGELFMRSREGYFGVYFPSCAATKEINTKITLEWAHKQFVTRVHTLFYFLHDITNPWMALKQGSSHIIPVFHSLALRSAGDVTIDWRWRHNDQTIVTTTWQMISNSLDIDFIHGDIHGRSCKNIQCDIVFIYISIYWSTAYRFVNPWYKKSKTNRKCECHKTKYHYTRAVIYV